MSTTAVARRYAGALVDLAEEQGCLDPVASDLAGFSALLEGAPTLVEALTSPGFTRDEQTAVMRSVLERSELHPIARNFLLLLATNGRMDSFDGIRSAVQERYDDLRGRVRAEVTSASPLDAATLKALSNQIKVLSDKDEVLVQARVDPALIGGIVTRVGDLVLDGSLRTQLDKMRTSLLGKPVGDA